MRKILYKFKERDCITAEEAKDGDYIMFGIYKNFGSCPFHKMEKPYVKDERINWDNNKYRYAWGIAEKYSYKIFTPIQAKKFCEKHNLKLPE